MDYKNNNDFQFVGIIQATIEKDTNTVGEYAELAFYIHPDFRRQGFAYDSCVALMKQLLNKKVDLIGIVFAVANTNYKCNKLMDKLEVEFGFIKSFTEVNIGGILEK